MSVTKSDVGLSNVANERQYSANNPPPYTHVYTWIGTNGSDEQISMHLYTNAAKANAPDAASVAIALNRMGFTSSSKCYPAWGKCGLDGKKRTIIGVYGEASKLYAVLAAIGDAYSGGYSLDTKTFTTSVIAWISPIMT